MEVIAAIENYKMKAHAGIWIGDLCTISMEISSTNIRERQRKMMEITYTCVRTAND